MRDKRRGVYPGTFDPVTFGHIDLIKRASRVFDEVIVAVGENSEKKPVFAQSERISMLLEAVKGIPNVMVEGFRGLVVDYAKQKKAGAIIRGLRMVSDFEYEFQMALTNRKLNPDVEVVFMMTKDSYSFISSKLIKEIASYGADLSDFVPDFVQKRLQQELRDG